MSGTECARCGRDFTGLTAFDRHQVTAYGTAVPVTCHDPAERGLVLNGRGRWGFPGTEENTRRLAQMASSRPAASTESDEQAGLVSLEGTAPAGASESVTGP